ncbi:Nucleic acid-binding protein [Corchorus olitorius]|uniref:Nucleic acid-binding protein n=1 Tax=Corchorus olitorius TaxID=93759 RepID=A0A1R3G3V1_9ROSI|nr:Nucleic acid-binding protein [Corchorus olitorius]
MVLWLHVIHDLPPMIHEPVKLFHCTLGKLKPSLRAFIVLLIFVTNFFGQGSTMQAIMPKAVARRFAGKIVEGCVYKFTRFDAVNCRLSYLAAPSDYIIFFNSSTGVQEITESMEFDYPRYFFRFATLEDLRARNEKPTVLTDVIGMLTIIGSKTSVNRASGNSSTDRRDIIIKLLRVNFWGLHVNEIDEEFLMSRASNPVLVITAGIVKEYNGIKYISSSSATKMYIDINVPETGQLKFDGILPPVKLLSVDESQSIEPVANPTDISVDEIVHWTEVADIIFCQGQRYRIKAKVVEMDITNGWFYESCPKCRVKLMAANGQFKCNDDGVVTPEFVMQLNLIIEDDTARIEVAMFGKQAEELIVLPLTRAVASQCLDKTKLPVTARDPTKSEVDFVFVIGVIEQTYKRGMKKFKVYSYSTEKKNGEPVVVDKGKKVVGYSGREMMGTGAGDQGTTKGDNIGVVPVGSNELVIIPDVVSTPQSHNRKREGSVPLDMPDSPCIPHDLFDTDSPDKRSRKEQECEEIMKGKNSRQL